MKLKITRKLFVGLVALASVGISHAANTMSNNCFGFPIQYSIKNGDTVSHIALAAYKNVIPNPIGDGIKALDSVNKFDEQYHIYTGHTLTIPCPIGQAVVARKRFIAPERVTPMPTEVATISAPEITLDAQVELPMFASAEFPSFAPPQPAGQEVVDEVAHAPVLQVALTDKDADQSAELSAYAANIQRAINTAKKRRYAKGYEITVHIPRGQVQGASAGTFSALLLENQDQYGEWQKWKKITTELQETSDGLLCTIILKKAPPQNSAVAIDFANGHSIFIASDLLAQGEITTQEVAKARPRKTYSALALANRLKPNKTLNALRFIAPTVIRSGIAFAFTGPYGLVVAPALFATDIATAKIRKSQRREEEASRPRIAVEYAIAGQTEHIKMLEHEVEMLKMQINSSGQTRNQLASNMEEKQ